jgi:FlaG/FlaF family flagellin (archaellin)
MVAITVILAAVIGAFVLEIGDQQETAPNTSFDSEERSIYVWGDNFGLNLSEVELAHAGGDVLSVSQTDIVVAGNDSAWGFMDKGDRANGDTSLMSPQPNVYRTAGTNEKATFQSGQTWKVSIRGDPESGGAGAPLSDEAVVSRCNTMPIRMYFGNRNNAKLFSLYDCDNDPVNFGWLGRNPQVALKQGEPVNIVWTAESGGKTQTLFKYQTQMGAPDYPKYE